ncbi:MAG: dihydroneopterin aldolase [Actinomycetota bacterium]
MTQRLFLSGIAADGRHGANPGEKDTAQPFVVDLDLEVQVDADDIGATADYRRLTDVARAVVTTRSFDLLETLAQQIAAAVRAEPNVVRATAIVHKPNAARAIGIDGVAAAATAD